MIEINKTVYKKLFNKEINSETIKLTEEEYSKVLKKHYPNIKTMASNVTRSIVDWAKSGFKTVNEKTLSERMNVCVSCEFWDKNGFGGSGRCVKCGCSTRLKLRLATSACPVGKW